MEPSDEVEPSPHRHPVARRASPLLALVALGWVLKKLLSRSRD
jgi:hypothetical protein